MIEVSNYGSKALDGVTLSVTIDALDISISRTLSIAANERNKKVFLSYTAFSELRLQRRAQLWWPYVFGDDLQFLYNISFAIDGGEALTSRFGIRQSTSSLVGDYDYLQFHI